MDEITETEEEQSIPQKRKLRLTKDDYTEIAKEIVEKVNEVSPRKMNF
jgi:hypothetical protein